MRRYLLLSLALIAACSDTTTTPPSQLNLDRPVDMAFACYGSLRITDGQPANPLQPIESSPMPIEACNIRSGPRTPDVPVPPGQEDLSAQGGAAIPPLSVAWYGFVLQSASGTVVLTRFNTVPSLVNDAVGVNPLDADPLIPGNNGISVGEDPVAIATDKVGCFEVTANAGSCDLSVLEVASALDADPAVHVDRIAVKNAAGAPILARPAAMVAEPPGGVIGARCSKEHATGLVYVAYPSCHLVAGIDTATGTVVTGIQYGAAGATITDGNVSCPAECGGGGVVTAGTRPVTLDIKDDPRTHTRRLVIGADNSSSLTVVELDPTTSRPQSQRPIALQQDASGSLGITGVALSPVIGMGGEGAVLNDSTGAGGQFQFVYAVATDNTVRVADILSLDKECDTQVDPRLIADVRNVRQLSCFPVGDPTTPARRAGARGPGIELIGDSVPTSVQIFRSENADAMLLPGNPIKLVGYFAVITSSSGRTFIANVDDDAYPDFRDPADPLRVQLPLAMAHQLRDALPNRGLEAAVEKDGVPLHVCETNGPDPDAQAGNSGGPRSPALPARNVPTGAIAPEKVGELPSLRQVQCVGSDTTKPVSELAFAAPDAVRDTTFPDLRGLQFDEVWTLTYEGNLSQDKSSAAADGPQIRESQMIVDSSGMRIVDQSRPFCDAGVEPFDIVQVRGCDPAFADADCPIGYSCYVHPNSQVQGIGACMLTSEADRLAAACKDYLTSQRRYTVGRSESGQLKLLPRKHVLRTTPLDGCVDDNQCKTLADYQARENTATQPGVDATTDTHTYACMADPDRAPVNANPARNKRCVQTCAQTSDCSTGSICQAGVCMEGVIPPQACVNAPQRYELRASEAFTVVGTLSGYVHPMIADAGGKCVRDPKANPLSVGRIPLAPPACDPTADPRSGRIPGCTPSATSSCFEPNPCSITVAQTENAPAYADPQSCTLASPATTMITRQAPAVRFRNRGMNLTLVDPYYPGDNKCIRDLGGALDKIPLTFMGYQLAFRQTAGFTPLLLTIVPSYPVKVVRGPTESIWVIDEGDFLSTSIAQASTRGKVYRIEPQALGQINLLE